MHINSSNCQHRQQVVSNTSENLNVNCLKQGIKNKLGMQTSWKMCPEESLAKNRFGMDYSLDYRPQNKMFLTVA